jgi:drug/metabolite transporter (DMT)-like permease
MGITIPAPDNKSTFMGLAAIVLWSTHIGVSRSLAESIGALTSTALMFLVAGLVGWVASPPRLSLQGSRSFLFVRAGLFAAYTVSLALAIGLSTHRQQTLEVAILNYLWPALTLLLAIPVLGQRARPTFFLGLALAVAAAILAPLRPGSWSPADFAQTLRSNPLPYVLAVLAAVLWALYSTLSRRWAAQASTSAVPLFSLGAGCALLALRPFFPEPFRWSPPVVLELTYMSLLPTLLAYSMWDRAMRKGHVTLVVACSYAIPVLSTLASALYLRVTVAWTVWVACALVAVGAFVSHVSMRNGVRVAAVRGDKTAP